MDFATLDTKSAAEKGAFLHLRHPVYGHPLMDGETAVGVTVRGTESKVVQDRLKSSAKARLDGDADQSALDFVCALVIEFHGVERDGETLTADDAAWFFGLSDSFVEQVIEFAKDRASFFKVASAS
jgi:hypothetical protein